MSVTTPDAARRALASAAAAGEAGAGAGAGGQGGEQPAQQDQEGAEGAAGEGGSANAPGSELQQLRADVQQLRADVQALRESCDQLVPRLQEVVVVCDTLQEKNAEHETLWAAIAPKLVRLDALLDTHANAPLGGQSGISGQTESVGQKQTAKGFLRYGQRITCAGGTQSLALCRKYQLSLIHI